MNNKGIIGLFASYPFIITSGENPRPNYDGINDPFLKNYIKKLAKLLSIKGNLNNLKIVYIGGYGKQKDSERAKLYLRAYNEYLEKVLDYLKNSFVMNNLTVIDSTDDIENIRKIIEDADFIFLGVGSDKVFRDTIYYLETNGIILSDIIKKNNTVLSTICSGSVMTSSNIYGGSYDNYYYESTQLVYPKNLTSLNCNPITMETDFCPNDQSQEKNTYFIENFLKPDSKRKCFFACRPNSYFLTDGKSVYAYGEIYLLIDGKQLLICPKDKKVNITELVDMINYYNTLKKNNVVIDNNLSSSIEQIISSLYFEDINTNESEIENIIVTKFRSRENIINKQREEWEKDLTSKIYTLESSIIDFLQNDILLNKYFNLNPDIVKNYSVDIKKNNYIVELYLKFNLIKVIKESYQNYPILSYSKFKNDLYEILYNLVCEKPDIAFFIVEVLAILFENSELKKILSEIKESLPDKEISKPNAYKNASSRQLMLFRRKYERR